MNANTCRQPLLHHLGCKRSNRQISHSILFQSARSITHKCRPRPVTSESYMRRGHHSLHNLSAFSNTIHHVHDSGTSYMQQFNRWTSTNNNNNNNINNNNTDDANTNMSFERIATSNLNEEEVSEKNVMLQDLSQQLAFLFSDFNLRNNEYGRSKIEQYDNEYLPLNDILQLKPIKRCVGDVHDPNAMVRNAIDMINKQNDSSNSQLVVQLHMNELDNGEIIVRRTPPFSYLESIKDNHQKMMVVEVRLDRKLKGQQSHLLALLCKSSANDDIDDDEIPISYYRHNHKRGVIDIEFESEEGAMKAWRNLQQRVGEDSQVQRISTNEQNSRLYKVQLLDEVSAIVRSIDYLSMSEEIQTVSDIETSCDVQSPDEETAKRRIRRKREWNSIKTPSLSQFTRGMNQLHQEHTQLPPASQEWLYRKRTKNLRQRNNKDDEEKANEIQTTLRHDLYRDVEDLVSTVKSSIERGKIRGLGGKDGYALSDALSRAMLIYSQTPVFCREQTTIGDDDDDGDEESRISPYKACLDIVGIMRSLNLDIHPSQYFYTIRSACHESRWEDAANLFLGQIDGNDTELNYTGGFVPIDSALGWDQPLELGLYAVARAVRSSDKHTDTSPSKEVFDTAMKMCMISPAGKDNYILAAGKALGRAGLWRDCVVFSTENDAISTYGPSVAAASMLACMECSRYFDATITYDLFMSDDQANTASEYQWGGGNITAVKPLCRDLLLCAMGKLKKRGGFGQDAINIFKEIIREDSSISTDALLGLFHSLEHDGDWSSSITLMKDFVDLVYRKKNPIWRITSDPLEVNKDDASTISSVDQNKLLADIVSSTMRACNSEGEYGLAIVLCSIINTAYRGKRSSQANWNNVAMGSNIVKSILSNIIVSEKQQILEAYITSLYGLSCENIVDTLLDASCNGKNIQAIQPFRKRRFKDAPHGESWINANIAIGRVLEAMHAIQQDASGISDDSRLLFERGLTNAIGHCLDCDQPTAALYLFEHASTILATKKGPTSLAGRVRTFLGVEDSYGSDRETSVALFKVGNTELKDMHLSDPLLAAVIKSYVKLGQVEKVQAAFDDREMGMNNGATIPQITNNALEALLDNVEECILFLDRMDVKYVNPTTFSIIARRFAQNGNWPEIGEVYNKAKRAGCHSEDLGLIAMQAVAEAELLDGKVAVLRRVARDVSHIVGLNSDDWIKSRYWDLKRNVGFHYARLLMRWNDPETSPTQELIFAVNQMRQCSSEGIVVKNAPLMCIVQIAKLYSTDGRALSVQQRQSSLKLILEACQEAKRSGLFYLYFFSSEVAHSLRILGANKECIQMMKEVVFPDGDFNIKSKHRIAMQEAIYAALEEDDHESLRLFVDTFERSGYDSSRLSIPQNILE